jgi:MFS family permease
VTGYLTLEHQDLWLQGLAVVLPQVEQELNPTRIEYAVLAEFAGLIVGATTWGILADIVGRKLSFNVRSIDSVRFARHFPYNLTHGIQTTLFIGGIFGLAAGGAPNFVTFSSLIACMGVGVGGK